MAETEGETDPSRLPRETFLVIPGDRLPEVIAREAGITGLASAGLLALLVVMVRRRKPA